MKTQVSTNGQAPLAASAFRRTVTQLAERHGLDVPVVLCEETVTCAVNWDVTPPTVEVNPLLLNEPDMVQQQAAAHEFGHRVEPRFLGQAWWKGVLYISGVLAVTPIIVTLVMLVAYDLYTPFMWAVAAALTAFVVSVFVSPAVHRRIESRADTYACGQGFHLSAESVALLQGGEPARRRLRALRTHPLPADRLAACRARCRRNH